MKITTIEGIGPANAEKLAGVQIKTVEKLLEKCGSRKGRQDVEKATGISASNLLEWVNRADLMRVAGIGEEYSDLLEAAGVDTVKELARRRSDSLLDSMTAANEKRNLVRRLPSEKQIARWIETAKSLPAMVSH